MADLGFLDTIGQTRQANTGSALAKVFEKYGGLFVELSQRNLLKHIPDADAGQLYPSIAFDVEIENGTYRFTIQMADYWEWVDKGRKPGKKPPLKPIVEWIHHKPTLKAKLGLTRSKLKGNKIMKLGDISAPAKVLGAAFAIQNSIGKKGTKATNFFSEVVNQTALNKMKNEITEVIGKEIEISITRVFVEAIK